MGTNNLDKVSNNIFLMLDETDDTTPYDWDNMPEFVQEDKEVYDEVVVRFRNQEDLEEFAKLVNQPNLIGKNKRKKSTYFPAVDRKANSLLFWVEEQFTITNKCDMILL